MCMYGVHVGVQGTMTFNGRPNFHVIRLKHHSGSSSGQDDDGDDDNDDESWDDDAGGNNVDWSSFWDDDHQ